MALLPSPISQVLLIGAFVAVASSAGLQWIGLSAQAEAARQQASRQTLADLSSLLHRFETAEEVDKPAVAEHLTDIAEQLSRQAKGEALASASRRVVALTSYETAREKELQERLRAEVQGLVNEAESLESAALEEANWLGEVNQIVLLMAAMLCGAAVVRGRRNGLAT